MGDEGEEEDEFRSSVLSNTRRRIVTKTSSEENTRHERTVAVTTQESSDGIREKAVRIARLDELEASSGAGRWSSSGRAESDKTKKANELVRVLVGQITEEGDIVVASDSKSELWRDVSLKRAIQNWNMKQVDVARPGSASIVFTSSERLTNHVKINEIERSWKIGDKDRNG